MARAGGRDPRLSLEQSQALTRVRTMGLGTALPVALGDPELARLAAVILADVGQDPRAFGVEPCPGAASYYESPLDWFSGPGEADFVAVYLRCLAAVPDFDTFFKALAELHKRRRKYAMILSRQPLPAMVQVAPRALLEFGTIPTPALASWMTWRKWFYDIDNRSAQETGYLFEPILASVLGGVAFGSRNSPVRRRRDPKKGRQVDCLVGTTAYEFKLRVTIAASGQGRFGEELDFAEDCRAARLTPVLLVLDPTPSPRLADLSREFERVGGEAFTGDAAWQHLEEQAGPTMATFVEKYVRQPLAEVDRWAPSLLNLSLERNPQDGRFLVTLFSEAERLGFSVLRNEDEALASDGEGSGDEAPPA